jgi:predicted aspartyl protease
MDDMGIFRTTIAIQALDRTRSAVALHDVIVDTGSEYTWITSALLDELGIRRERKQRFRLADGSVIERDLGYAIVHAGGTEAPDLVVFAEESDAVLLGAHSIEGMNLKLDLASRQLVPAGPIITVMAA